MIECDRPTDEERATGRTRGPLKLHRWRRPVALGDRCACGEREADAVLVVALKETYDHENRPDAR
jgi:hypothetical protein